MKVTYRLWQDSTVIDSWDSPQEAHAGLAGYVRDNPEQLPGLHFAMCMPTLNEGLKILSSVRGNEIQTYLDDLGVDMYLDEGVDFE